MLDNNSFLIPFSYAMICLFIADLLTLYVLINITRFYRESM
jgi:hypothetical protein